MDEAGRAAVFSGIAGRYDTINTAISLGLDSFWRRALLRALPEGFHPRRILDVCCGTGALLSRLARVYPEAALTGLDFSPAMLARAAERVGQRPRLILGDQNDLPFPDRSFSLVTNAFGLRNSVDPQRALREMDRVLSPGGVMAVLELTRPGRDIASRLFRLYFKHLAPRIAVCLGGEEEAYRYLARSVLSFHDRAALADLIRVQTGCTVRSFALFGPMVSLLLGRKPWGLRGG